MDGGPDGNIDDDSDSDSRDGHEGHEEEEDDDSDDYGSSSSSSGDDHDNESLVDNLALSRWGVTLLEAFDRRASLAEIRPLLILQRTSDGTWPREEVFDDDDVGAWVLQQALRRSRGRQQEPRRGGGGYPTLPLVKFLVEEVGWGPSILHTKDRDGYLALHVAILESCPPNVVKYLVKKAPEAVQVRVWTSVALGRWFFPIHLAVDCPDEDDEADDFDMLPWDTVHCLLDAWPESIRRTSYRGWAPLHHALRHLHRDRPEDRRVVRGLVERWPESLAWKTEDGHEQLAFHVAVSELAPVQDLRYLLHAHPEAIRTPSGASHRRYLPLHLAFVRPDGTARPWGVSPLPTIRFLVEAFPSAVKERTSVGLLPLHLALTATDDGTIFQQTPRLDVVQYLVESYPQAVREAGDPYHEGWIALFYAVSNPYTSPDLIRYLVEKYPASVQVRDLRVFRLLPMHLAVGTDLSVEAFEALIRAWPEALQEGTSDGDLPIHWLLYHQHARRRRRQHDHEPGILLDVVKCLVAHSPSSLTQKSTVDGRIPLHVALLQSWLPDVTGAPEEEQYDAVVEFLLEQVPESVRIATGDRGWLALHCAAENGRSPRVLRSLLNMWPNSVRQVTRDDDRQLLAIHLAAASARTRASSLRILMDAWPDSIWEWSGEGRLPIHYAADQEGRPEAIQCLLEGRPDATAAAMIATPSRDGLLPIHLAALRSCFRYGNDCAQGRREKLEVVRCLVERGPPGGLLLSRAPSAEGSLPLHLAVRSESLDVDVVKYLIDQCPESVRHPDNNGSLVLHVLVAEVQGDRRPAHRTKYWNPAPYHRRLERLLGAAKLLVSSHPESLLQKDSGGRLPLHLAAEGDHASLDVVYLLLRRRPESIQGGGSRETRGVEVGGRGRQPRRPAMAASSRGRRSSSASRAASSKRRRSDARAGA